MFITLSGSFFQGTTNIRKLREVYFSIKKRKFVKPVRRYGDRVSGFYEYILTPGIYIMFSYYMWTKQLTPSLEISMVKIKGDDGAQVVENVKIVKISNEKIEELVLGLGFRKMSEIIKDFLKSVPGYHIRPDIMTLSEKIYDQESVNELLEFMNRFNGEEVCYNPEVE